MLIFSTSSFADGKNCGAVTAMPDVKNDDEQTAEAGALRPARTSSNRPDKGQPLGTPHTPTGITYMLLELPLCLERGLGSCHSIMHENHENSA